MLEIGRLARSMDAGFKTFDALYLAAKALFLASLSSVFSKVRSVVSCGVKPQVKL